MLPHADINLDIVLQALLDDMVLATNGWLNGEPKDEPSLMNRITERLSRSRRKCDVGVNYPIEVITEFFSLHRQGPRQVDQYGSDLAVTIKVAGGDLTKTAFFQLKVSQNYKARLDRAQLQQPSLFPDIEERSFVLAIDNPGRGYRIHPTTSCKSNLRPGYASAEFDTSEWEYLAKWVLEWFDCKHAPASDPNDLNTVEALLEKYRQAAAHDYSEEIIAANLPRDIIPSRNWLRFSFQRK